MGRRGGRVTRDGARAQFLIERAQQTSDLNALENAIALLHRILAVIPHDNPGYALYLSNLGAAWHTRFAGRTSMAWGQERELRRTGRRAQLRKLPDGQREPARRVHHHGCGHANRRIPAPDC
jgi:hypothetical protein